MPLLSMPKPENFEKLNDDELATIDEEKSVTVQFLTLANILALTDEDLQERKHIVNKIHNILRQYYPECVLLMFGSSVNGFGCKGCDLDLLFLPFPSYCNLDFSGCEETPAPSVYRVRRGIYPVEKLYNMNEKSHLQFVKKIMYSEKWLFRRITFIPAKCPILNIEFTTSDIKCDFSCSNRLVSCNTALLALFSRLDLRVKSLVISLRYWAKSLGFIKKSLLSSYALTFMIIFALQNTDPPVLPPVKTLSEIAGFSFKIDGWETAIPSDRNIFLYSERIGTKNNNSFKELLIHFFDFYWNFDFVQNVVSPYYGRPLPIKELLQSSDERIREFQITSFSIQDPFVLNRNLSRNAAMKTSFKLSLLIAKELILQGNFSLCDFLNAEFYQNRINLVQKTAYNYVGDRAVSNSLNLTYNLSLKLGLTDHLQPWYEKVSQIAYEVLTYGLLMKCEVVDKIIWPEESYDCPPRKKQKIESDSNKLFEGNLELISSIQCIVSFETWKLRKKVQIPEDINVDINLCDTLKKEYIISKLLLPESCQTTEPPALLFKCNIYKYASAKIPDILFIFTSITNEPEFEVLSTFLKSYVVKTVESVLCEN